MAIQSFLKKAQPPARERWRFTQLRKKQLRYESLFALLPVAGAELVGLQRIEHTQHFLRVAADRQIGDVDEANDAFRIDNEGGALGDAGVDVENAELARTDRASHRPAWGTAGP